MQKDSDFEVSLIADIPQHRPLVRGITIDGTSSRDLDDAIWIETREMGAKISVHIADVAESIEMHGLLDKRAIAKVETKYFRNGNAPMLPRSLSEDKLSLLGDRERATITVEIYLDCHANIERTEIFESRLINARQFNYEEVDSGASDLPFSEILGNSYFWAEKLYMNRIGSGSIGAIFTAGGLWLDEDGNSSPEKRYKSHLLVQEFMILANRAVAQKMAEQDVPILFRNQTVREIAPDRQTMYQTMLALGSAEQIRQRSASWLHRAKYGPSLSGHFALNLPAYCHFTSPIRRLADLVNHRIVKALLRGQKSPYSKQELEQLGDYIQEYHLAREQESLNFYKQQHQKSQQVQIQSADLSNLTSKEFAKTLKYAVKEGKLDAIGNEIENRFKSRQIAVADAYLLLFESNDPIWQQRTFKYIEHPHEAASIMAIASSCQGWELEYVESGKTPEFKAWLLVTIEDKILTTREPATDRRKQAACHQACLLWIQAYLEDALVAPIDIAASESEEVTEIASPPVNHPILSQELKDGQFFTSLLFELCQGLGWEDPVFSFEQENEIFTCTCEVRDGDRLFTGIAAGTKKQKIKHQAARRVLEQLQHLHSQQKL